MAKRRLFFLILIMFFITLLLFILISCQRDSNSNEIDEEITLWIYPTGGSSAYHLTLYSDNTLKAIIGRTESIGTNVTEPITISKIIKQDEVKLYDETVSEIYEKLDRIYSNPEIEYDSRLFLDSWMLKLEYKDKTIVQNCFVDISKEVKELYDILVEKSLLKIDITGLGIADIDYFTVESSL
ncbi:MAG: hypothetical protein K2F81_08300 [Ruminococcus sp.]|nr:hypothetical protein [Ruminococcus sp.]